MSTAIYPIGMRAMPSSGYNHKSTHYNTQYISWKGSGPDSPPPGLASGHIRPFTNRDPGNIFPTGFGLPRPMKHYRKGRMVLSENIDVNPEVDYNIRRFVKSGNGTSLGGGGGGSGLLNELQDHPGQFVVKSNDGTNVNNIHVCVPCQGTALIASYYPNKPYLEENPQPITQSRAFCCNDEKKARRRCIYASTNLSKRYNTTHFQYLQQRCLTYQQKSFNYMNKDGIAKPGSPTALTDEYTYVGNCQPNTEMFEPEIVEEACGHVAYKPNNYQYATQGAVSSSTRILKQMVDTISTNAASMQRNNNTGQSLVSANELYAGVDNSTLLKNKHSATLTKPPFQNKKACFFKLFPSYQLSKSQPSPYRDTPGVIFSSNHYSQSPNTYITTHS